MRGYFLTAMLFSAITAETYAYPLSDSIPRGDKERVPSVPDEIPPFDDKPHPETKPAKTFPDEEPPFDPQPYPGTSPSSPIPVERPSFESQPDPESGPEQDPESLRVRRSLKDDKNQNTVKYDPKNDSFIVENSNGLSRNKDKPQFAPSGSFPWY